MHDELAERFEAHRERLRALAYRLLGSSTDAEDAVQQAWSRLSRVQSDHGTDEIDSLGGWLRTVVTRICLDTLRTRRSRREDLTGQSVVEHVADAAQGPEEQALLADQVSRALLVVLDTLDPAERIAFVLHDMFAVPFDQIAPLVERTPATTKKLASRARHKVRGTSTIPAAELARRRQVVAAFLDAARDGDLAGVLAVLAPDVVRRADPAALPVGAATELRGARAVAEGTVALAGRAHLAELVLVNGDVGAVLASGGRLLLALTFTVADDKITSYEVIADPASLQRLNLAILDAVEAVDAKTISTYARGRSPLFVVDVGAGPEGDAQDGCFGEGSVEGVDFCG